MLPRTASDRLDIADSEKNIPITSAEDELGEVKSHCIAEPFVMHDTKNCSPTQAYLDSDSEEPVK